MSQHAPGDAQADAGDIREAYVGAMLKPTWAPRNVAASPSISGGTRSVSSNLTGQMKGRALRSVQACPGHRRLSRWTLKAPWGCLQLGIDHLRRRVPCFRRDCPARVTPYGHDKEKKPLSGDPCLSPDRTGMLVAIPPATLTDEVALSYKSRMAERKSAMVPHRSKRVPHVQPGHPLVRRVGSGLLEHPVKGGRNPF